MRALVVEPDDTARRLLLAILRARRHEADGVATEAEAAAAYARERPELLVVPRQVETGAGLALARRLDAAGGGAAGAFVVVVTDDATPAHHEELIEGGADDVLAKPLDVAAVHVRLAALERAARRLLGRLAPATPPPAAPSSPPTPRPSPPQRGALLDAGEPAPVDDAVAEPAPDRDGVRAGGKRYEVLGKVAQGGTSEIYKAFDNELGVVVALKIIRNEWSGDEKWAARLRQEIRLTRQVKSEHVAQIYEFGRYGGRFFLAMEYIPGVPLAQVIEERAPLSEDEALSIGLQAADGMEAVHELGIVHRDFKSSNLMVTPEGKAILLDFGLARRPEDLRLTHDGLLLGTPFYMSPELIEDKPFGAPSDVYSFGCVLYEMLTGQVPFQGNSLVSTARMHLMERPRPLRALNPRVSQFVEGVVMRCLAKNPADRYADAGELGADLRRARDRLAHRETAPAVRRRVLLGEGDPGAAAVLVAVLDRLAIDAELCADGHVLVESALGESWDAVLLDVAMPRISGLEIAQILRSFPKTATVPIVLLSERESDQRLASLVPRGGEFLGKPVDEGALVHLLRTLGLVAAA